MFTKFLLIITITTVSYIMFSLIKYLHNSNKQSQLDKEDKGDNKLPRWEVIQPSDISYCTIGSIRFVPKLEPELNEDTGSLPRNMISFTLNPDINYGELQTWMGVILNNPGRKDIYALNIRAKLKSGLVYNLSGCYISNLSKTGFKLNYDFGTKKG